MLTLLLRSVVVLTIIVAAIFGHLAKLMFGFEAGLVVLVLVLVGLQTAIPAGALALNAPGFLRLATPERRWLASAAEIFAFWRAFVTLMPFDVFWMGDEKPLPSAPKATPIILVPGYCCNRGMWFDLARDLEQAGRVVAPVTLGWPFSDIDQLAEALDQHIARVRRETGASKVLLVGHSMGGLIARARLARRGGDDVAGLITLATPHQGAQLAKLAPGRSARQMEPDSAWLAALNAKETPVPVHAFWAGRDEFVSPPDAARLPGAPETCAPLAGHLTVLQQPEVLKKILSASEAAVKIIPVTAPTPAPSVAASAVEAPVLDAPAPSEQAPAASEQAPAPSEKAPSPSEAPETTPSVAAEAQPAPTPEEQKPVAGA